MTEEPPRRGRGRPRKEGADQEILAATRDLLRATGFAAFTVDLVAERTGVAKTTIYRRWPSKGALVAAAIAERPSEAHDPSSIVRETATLLRLLTAPDGDAAHVIREVIRPRRAMLADTLREAHGVDAAMKADLILGGLLTRFLAGDDELDDASAEAVLRAVETTP
jgi:hypothetical protein